MVEVEEGEEVVDWKGGQDDGKCSGLTIGGGA